MSLMERALRKGKRILDTPHLRQRDLDQSTHWTGALPALHIPETFKAGLDIGALDHDTADYLCEQYLGHCFDLLGSGWVSVGYGAVAAGCEDQEYPSNVEIAEFDREGNWLDSVLLPAHTDSAREIWKLVGPGYEPINWQRDFKSGFCWSATEWYRDVKYGELPGVDIKLPWELARLQHLPQMALFCRVLPERGDEIRAEIRNQVLDFIALNPPRMGVNWVCPMDVAIRAANIGTALMLEPGLSRSAQDTAILARALYEHCRHVLAHLEWSERYRNNHYLADIAGILVASLVLESSDEVAAWRLYGLQELVGECRAQFYADGGNIESSTGYHRLVSEMLALGAAAAIGLNRQQRQHMAAVSPADWPYRPALREISEQEFDLETPHLFPDWFFERLHRAAHLISDLTKPCGDVPQIGDNDSGRFLKLSPVGGEIDDGVGSFWQENGLNHCDSLGFIDGLFSTGARGLVLERSFVRALADGAAINVPPPPYSKPRVRSTGDPARLGFHAQSVIDAPNGPLDIEQLVLCSYPDSGIYIVRSEQLYLAVSATPIGQMGMGGHAHNDALSFDLSFGAVNLVSDPGTYLYTASPEWRNRFRSVDAHHGILVDGEPNRWKEGVAGLFSLDDEVEIDVLECTPGRLRFEARWREIRHIRQFAVSATGLTIDDWCSRKFAVNINRFPYHSPGYGRLISLDDSGDSHV